MTRRWLREAAPARTDSAGRHDEAPRAARWAIVAALSLASLLVVFADSAVSVTLPVARRELGLDSGALEWALNAYTLALAVVLLLAGQLTDRLGPRYVLVLGLAVFSAASVPAGLADSAWPLIGARAIQGIGAGLVVPSSLAAMVAVFPSERRGLAVGLWSGLSAIGLGVGPLFGSVIVEYVGWGALFLVNLPLGVVVMVLVVLVVSGPRGASAVEFAPGRPDLGGALLAGATVLFVLLALTQAGSDGWKSGSGAMFVLAAFLATIAFTVVERRAGNPVLPLEFFRSGPLLGASAVGFLATAAMCSLFVFVSLYLQSVAEYRLVAVGAAFLPMTTVIVVGSPLAGLLCSRVAARFVAAGGMALLSASLLLLSRIESGLPMAGIVLGLTLAGAGIALTAVPVTGVALAEVPGTRPGLAGALVGVARTVGLAVGVASMGAILGDADGAVLPSRLSWGLQVNAAIALVGAAAALALLSSAPLQDRLKLDDGRASLTP